MLVDGLYLQSDVLVHLMTSGHDRHWITRAKSATTFRIIRNLGPGDDLAEFQISSEARKKDPLRPPTSTLGRFATRERRYLIHDRDPLFTEAFRAVLGAAGIQCLKLPPQSPNLNAVAERFVLSIKSECLDRLVPLGERHLRLTISEFVEHYHLERNHQGLESRLRTVVAAATNENTDPSAPIARRERLGGILSYYYRRTA